MYIGTKKEASRIYESVNERWEYVVAYNPDGNFEQVSFVNGIWTMLGGTHIQYIVNLIVTHSMINNFDDICVSLHIYAF